MDKIEIIIIDPQVDFCCDKGSLFVLRANEDMVRLAEMIEKSKFKSQASFLILDGINFAGFNIVDLPLLSKRLGIAVIAVQRKKPRMQRIEKALDKFKDKKKRMELIEKAGEIYPSGKIFFQCFGTDRKTVKTVLAKTTKYSNIPEPLRLAHMIASGTTLGESTRP